MLPGVVAGAIVGLLVCLTLFINWLRTRSPSSGISYSGIFISAALCLFVGALTGATGIAIFRSLRRTFFNQD